MSIRSFIDASKPEPIAKPSGKLCRVKPIPTAIPVLSSVFFFDGILFRTSISQITITHIPNVIPVMTIPKSDVSNASGIRSKHTIDIIKPDANDNMKLSAFFDVFFNFTPIIPPDCCAKCSKE